MDQDYYFTSIHLHPQILRIFFPDLPKTEKTNRIEGIVYKERKKALVILRRKQNRLFAKKNIPIDLKKTKWISIQIPTEALLKCISIIKCFKLVG